MSFKFNPLTGELDLVGSSSSSLDATTKLKWHLESLKAFDKVVSVTRLNSGLPNETIEQVVYSSSSYPLVNITKDVFYLQAGTKYQRIEKVEYSGLVFEGDSIRKNFVYDANFSRVGFNYEVF